MENKNEDINPYLSEKTKGKKAGIIISIVILVVTFIIILLVVLLGGNKKEDESEKNSGNSSEETVYKLSSNKTSKFDLAFLKLENEAKNKIYSPLSIKYALLMLNEGTSGKSNRQIANIVDNYEPKSYINNSNRSFANALFIRDSYKDSVKSSYTNTLSSKYNADVIYDSFETPTVLNKWVSDKTFKLIDNLFDDVKDKDFILVNALAIDMEWKNKIQPVNDYYDVNFNHEKFNAYVSGLNGGGYGTIEFNNGSRVLQNRKVSQIAAVANRYDIIKDLGEDNIRKEVTDAYTKWVKEGAYNSCGTPEAVDKYVNKYMEDIKKNYGHLSRSTDFSFYDDENVKLFAKDLKEYDGSTLEYISLMPKNTTLIDYIDKLDENSFNDTLDKLKDTNSMDIYEDNYITYIKGNIPLFKFEYELKLMDDLKSIGIKDVFDSEKADLSKITSSHAYIADAGHKANIEFSNDGIKASAATMMGGLGAMDCGFEYDFDVPVKEIDLTFDNPYMFIIRDKDTKEIWFVGTVYEPIEKENDMYYW